MWYDYNNLLSRNSVINMVIGSRGHGKTYGAIKKGVKDYLKNGSQFMYVRRYKSEIDDTYMTFFDDIKKEFPGHVFETSKKYGKIDGKICCFFAPLSTSGTKKSIPYPNISLIIFDEFIIDKKNVRYISGECNLFHNLVETVVRMRDNCNIICLANNVTICNPYFEYYKIYPNFKSGIKSYYDGLITVEMDDGDNEFLNQKLKTRWGRLSSMIEFGKHSLHNEQLIGNDSFVNPNKPSNMKFSFSITLNNREIGVWKNANQFYVDDKIISSSKLRFVLQKDDLTPDLIIVNKVAKSTIFYVFSEAFKLGQVEFKNQFIKECCFDVFKYIGIR